jgi:hypothetical protein
MATKKAAKKTAKKSAKKSSGSEQACWPGFKRKLRAEGAPDLRREEGRQQGGRSEQA